MMATELMVDEIATELGLDPIEFRLRNVLKAGMKNAQGAIADGTQRAEAVLERRLRTHCGPAGSRASRHTKPRTPESIMGLASAASSGDLAMEPKPASPRWNWHPTAA